MTLACAHAQQLIWQLFNAVEKGAAAAGETDEDFLTSESMLTSKFERWNLFSPTDITDTKTKMDKGIHIGSWGQLQGKLVPYTILHMH